MPASTQDAATASDLRLDQFAPLLMGDRRASLALLAAEWCREMRAEGCAIFVPVFGKSDDPDRPESLEFEAGFPTTLAEGWRGRKPTVEDFRSGWLGEVAFNKATVRLGAAELVGARANWRPDVPTRSVLAVPVFGRKNRVAAVLEFVDRQGDGAEFDEADEAKGRELAEEAAHFLFFDRCRELFMENLPQLAQAGGLTALNGVVLRLAIDLLEADRGDLAVCDSPAGALSHQLSIPPLPTTAFDRDCLMQQVWRDGKPCRIDDVTKSDKPYHSVDPTTRSDLAVRWEVGGQPRGVLNVESRQVGHFTAQDESLLGLIGKAIPHFCRLLGEVLSYDEFSRHMTASPAQHSDVVNMVLESVCRTHEFEGGLIYLLTPGTQRLSCQASFGCSGIGLAYDVNGKDFTSLAARIFANKEGQYIETPVGSVMDQRAVTQLGITGAVVGLPMLQHDKPLGVLLLWSNVRPRHARPEHVEMLAPVARLAATTIALADAARLPVEAVLAHRDLQKKMYQQDANLDDCLDQILDALHETSGFERIRLYLYNEPTHSFECLKSRGMPDGFEVSPVEVKTGHYSGDVFDDGKINAAARVYYPRHDKRGVSPIAEALGKQKHLPWAVLPLRVNGVVCGQIAADNAVTQKVITSRSLDVLNVIGGLVNQVIGNERLNTGNRLTAALGTIFETLQQTDARSVVVRRLLVAATHSAGLGFCRAVFLGHQELSDDPYTRHNVADERLHFIAADGCLTEEECKRKHAEEATSRLEDRIAAVNAATTSALDLKLRDFSLEQNSPGLAELFQKQEAKLFVESHRGQWPAWVCGLADRLGSRDLLIAPVVIDRKPAGLIAVDRAFEKRRLSKTETQALEQFSRRLVALILRQHALSQEVREATELATMGAVVRSITHEIRSHLTSLAHDPGNVQKYLAGHKYEKATESAHRLEKAAASIIKIVDDMELLRAPAEGLVTGPIRPILEEAVADRAARASGLGVELGIGGEVPTESFPLVARLLTTGLENLVSNALDAFERTPKDFRVRRVELLARLKGEWLTLGVRDNGPGIPEDHLKPVRQRGITFTTRPGKGMGFGVEIARRAAEAHVAADGRKGHLEIHSVPGQGTDVWIVLPVAPQGR